MTQTVAKVNQQFMNNDGDTVYYDGDCSLHYIDEVEPAGIDICETLKQFLDPNWVEANRVEIDNDQWLYYTPFNQVIDNYAIYTYFKNKYGA